MSKKVTIYSDNTIAVDGKITGYSVSQRSEGTVVCAWHNNGYPRPVDLGDQVRMPKRRYTLSAAAGRAEFDRDFLALWVAGKEARDAGF